MFSFFKNLFGNLFDKLHIHCFNGDKCNLKGNGNSINKTVKNYNNCNISNTVHNNNYNSNPQKDEYGKKLEEAKQILVEILGKVLDYMNYNNKSGTPSKLLEIDKEELKIKLKEGFKEHNVSECYEYFVDRFLHCLTNDKNVKYKFIENTALNLDKDLHITDNAYEFTEEELENIVKKMNL